MLTRTRLIAYVRKYLSDFVDVRCSNLEIKSNAGEMNFIKA